MTDWDHEPEAWLRGPIPGIDPFLMPVAHAFAQAKDDLHRLAAGPGAKHAWTRPGTAAPVAFHVIHLAGSVDRLLTYARGQSLTAAQMAALNAEGTAGASGATLEQVVATAAAALDRALAQVRDTPRESLLEPRRVGRAGLPSTVLGLLFHAAEHTTRHVGQAISTVKALTGG